MALPDLVSRLEQEAQSRIDGIRRQADAEVRAIEAATEDAVAELINRHVEQARALRTLACQQELAAARRQARAELLEARDAQLARILKRAEVMLGDASSFPSYSDAIVRHLEEALSFVEGLQPRVRCQSVLAGTVRQAVGRRTDVDVVVDDSVGPGLVVEAGAGSVVVDNTLAARLRRAEPRLLVELSRRLEEPPPSTAAPARGDGGR
jgi:vacuolar-type H+-ATPase subunit E/Vma4